MTVQPDPTIDHVVPEATASVDKQAVELRAEGKSYAIVARTLGLDSARLAHEAFSRGLRQYPAGKRAALRKAEGVRLDALADKTNARADLSSEQRSKRLRSIERLRQTVMMD
jgi:hypothetical protein